MTLIIDWKRHPARLPIDEDRSASVRWRRHMRTESSVGDKGVT